MPSTITAIATGGGRGAIAIIRVSGPKSLDIYKKLTKKNQYPTPGQLKPAWIYDNYAKVDHAMLVYFKSPNSFTGEDLVEIHCHGSGAITSQITELIIRLGGRHAKPGEFSERAYHNGKIDLSQAEAIMELVSSENTQTARLATRQLAGEFSGQINDLKSNLVSLNAAVSADIDFSEEDTPSISKSQIEKNLKTSHKAIQKLQANSELLPKLKNGIHVALVGLPNAGKSTLLNALLGFDRSIVTEIAGTTRDTVSENVEINGINYHFVDTAGLNDRPDKVEKIGIKRTLQTIESADVVILLTEPSKLNDTKQYLKNNNLDQIYSDPKTILVFTKSDLEKPPKNQFAISAKAKTGLKELISKIEKRGKTELAGEINILTERQGNLLSQAEVILTSLVDNINSIDNDIISAELEASINILSELTGEQANQQIIDSIFRSFCIGK